MNLAEEAKKFAVAEMEKYGLPNPIHFDLSEKKAIELAQKLGADQEIVKAGAYLMDVKLGQAFQEGKVKEHVEKSQVGDDGQGP